MEYTTVPEAQEGAVELETLRANAARPHSRQTKAKPAPGGGGGGGSPPSSPECTWEEQIQTIILQPASKVKVIGIGDAGGQREGWHWQD